MTDAEDKAKLQRVAAKLKRARLASGLTQAEVAKRAGISETHYAQVERAEKNPSTTVLIDILRVIGVTPNDAIGE